VSKNPSISIKWYEFQCSNPLDTKKSFDLSKGEKIMSLEFGKSHELLNTQLGPLGVLTNYYTSQKLFKSLDLVSVTPKDREIVLGNKLYQVIVSILGGCRYINEVNTKLRPERILAQVNGIDRFSEQSTLGLALNGLSQMNLMKLRESSAQISRRCSRVRGHDWRGLLMLDFDLSGLPCSKEAEKGEKGYFAGKKIVQVVN